MPRKRQASRKFRGETGLTNDQALEMLMFGDRGNCSEAEIEALRSHLCGDAGGRKMFESWLAEPASPPEPILSDEDGALILADPLAYAEHVPGGFRAWVHRQVDGPQLWRDWLENIRRSQIERSTTNA